MPKITNDELSYDLTRIPAVNAALAKMERDEAEKGRGPAWDALLDAAANLMDDEIREELHDQWSEDRSPCDFIAVYAARHEAKHGARFDF